MPFNSFGWQNKRHVAAYVTPYTINYSHYRNPWVIAWWSAAFPGIGHMMLNKYLTALVLMTWEYGVNYIAGINLAIFHSVTGELDLALDALDIQWFLFYITAYIFTIWDGYKKAIESNRCYLLMQAKNFTIVNESVSMMERNELAKRSPLMAVLWSFLAPGVGHLYLNRLTSAIWFIVGFLVILYYSSLLPAIHYTMEGQFAEATKQLNVQWFLNIPSLYIFVAYDAYTNTVENNRLFEKEMALFFEREYQTKPYEMPI